MLQLILIASLAGAAPPEAAPDAGTPASGAELALVVTPPELLEASPAPYPAGSDSSGTVQLHVLVDERGAVSEVKLVGGIDAALDEAAVSAARKLRFHPAQSSGQPVAVWLPYAYTFAPPAPPPVQGELAGTVRTAGNRRLIAGATVLLGDKPVAETDATGRFLLQLPGGAITLRVTAPGHVTATYEERVTVNERLESEYRLRPSGTDTYETVVRAPSERTEVARQTLTGPELREVPGTMGDPFRVVMLMPGVSGVASGISYPIVRGAQPAATTYSIDGVRIPILFHLLGGPAVVHPEFLEQIDFVASTPSAKYGRNLGGVVDARSAPATPDLHASVYADLVNSGGLVRHTFEQTGTEVTLAGRFSYSGWLTGIVSNRLSAGNMNLGGSFWDYQARVIQPLSRGSLRVLALGSSDDLGMDSAGAHVSANTRFHRVDLAYRTALAGGDLELGMGAGVDSAGYGVVLEQDWDGDGVFDHEEQMRYRLRSASFTARALYSGELTPTLKLHAGADLDHRRADGAMSASSGPDETSAFRAPNTLSTFAGAFGELRWTPLPALQLTGGLRVDNFHLTPGINHASVDPRLTAAYRVADWLLLKAGAGITHGPPTTMISLPVLDVAGLRYGLQEARSVDAGFDWTPFNGFTASVSGYYTHLPRAYEFDVVRVLQARQLGPAEEPTWGRSYGLELMLRHETSERWFGWISYSLGRSERFQRFARLDGEGELIGWAEKMLPAPFDQTHNLNAAFSLKLPANYTLGAVFHFNTGRPESGQLTSRTAVASTDVEGRPFWRSVDRDQITRLPSHLRVDVRAAKKWIFDDFELEAYLDLQNASVSWEVLGYYYSVEPLDRYQPESPVVAKKTPLALPVVLPMLGLKATY